MHTVAHQYNFTGVVLGKPWAWITNGTDPLDPKYLDPTAKNMGLEGYCVDLLMELAKIMDFEFEIVPSKRNQGLMNVPIVRIHTHRQKM